MNIFIFFKDFKSVLHVNDNWPYKVNENFLRTDRQTEDKEIIETNETDRAICSLFGAVQQPVIRCVLSVIEQRSSAFHWSSYSTAIKPKEQAK